jgi:hypothetical protein
MFGRHKVAIPPGVKAVVKGHVVAQSPLHIGTDDLVYFISLVPYICTITGQAACKEGIAHVVSIQVRLGLLDSELDALLLDAGHSSYPKFVTITAQDRAERYKVPESLRAATQTFIQGQSFFALQREDHVKSALHPLLQAICQLARLDITIEACTSTTQAAPSEAQLAELATRAGKTVTVDEDGTPRVEYVNHELGQVVDYFDMAQREQAVRDVEARRQQGLNDVAIERTKAENEVAIERTRAEAGPELEKLRRTTLIEQTTSKIRALDEENRLKAHEAELRKQEQLWESEAIKRNNDLMEMRAQYEAAYKRRRQDEDIDLRTSRLEARKSLAGKKAELLTATVAEQEIIRREKQLDAELEIERERQLMAIRADEFAKMSQYVGALLEKVEIPVPNYGNVHTLVLGANGNQSSDLMTTLLMELLNRFVDGLGPHKTDVSGPQ